MAERRQYRIEVFQAKDGEWRWRMRARNGKIVADSGEGYRRKQGAVRAALQLLRAGLSAAIVVAT